VSALQVVLPAPADPGPIIAAIGVFTTIIVGFVALGPIGRAIAERLRGKAHAPALDTGEVAALRDEVAGVRQQVAELAERQDFAERLLAQVRERGLLQAPKER
jgi:hypothetical protein